MRFGIAMEFITSKARGLAALSMRKRVRLATGAFVVLAVLLGFVDSWIRRYDIDSDALSYLEISEAFRAGHWHDVINTHWSPLYPGVLAAGLALAKPEPQQESTIVHLITFGIYLTTVASFGFLIRELLRSSRNAQAAASRELLDIIPELCIVTIAWVLFLWSSLQLIGVATVSPDMLVATLLYLASGLLLRLHQGQDSWGAYIALGVVLGIGYLAKTVMFPMGCIYLGSAVLAAGRHRRASARTGLAAGIFIFLVLSCPLVVALSVHSGRLTIGSSGPWNYARFVNGIGRPVHWQGQPVTAGTPVHPTRRLMDAPAVYEFAYPVPGTYPPWRDPMYWYEGIRPHFDLRGSLGSLGTSARFYVQLIGGISTTRLPVLDQSVVLALLVLAYTAGHLRATAKGVADQWPLLLPAIAGMGMYALVYTEPRYIGAFVVLLLVGCFAGLRLSAGHEVRRLAQAFALVILATWAASAAYGRRSAFRSAMDAALGVSDGQPNVQWEIATALREKGLAGLPAGYIGSSYGFYWAHLAHNKVVAEIRDLSFVHSASATWINMRDRASLPETPNDVELFWSGQHDVQERAYAAFRKAGARLVVADAPQSPQLPDGWETLGQTGLVVYGLTDSRQSTPSLRP